MEGMWRRMEIPSCKQLKWLVVEKEIEPVTLRLCRAVPRGEAGGIQGHR